MYEIYKRMDLYGMYHADIFSYVLFASAKRLTRKSRQNSNHRIYNDFLHFAVYGDDVGGCTGRHGFNFDIDEYESISNVEIDSKEETYSDLIKSNIEKTLTDADYENSKVKVTVKLKDDELYIQSADIYILDDYDSKEVKDFLFEKLGINAKVYYIGE